MTLTELLTRLKELALQAEKRNIITNSRDALFFRNMTTPENILKLLEVIETQREALEFYASTTRWEATTHDSTYDGIGCTDFETFKSISMGPSQVGGRTARQALTRCEKVIQEGMK